MKSMTWTPDEAHDKKVNQYLEQINHAPYEVIAGSIFTIFCFCTALILVGIA